MYCPRCKLDIPDPQKTRCPLCDGELIAPSKKRARQTDDGDQRLRELIADVKKSLEEIPGEADAGIPAHDAQPPTAEQYGLDAADEAAFSINLQQDEAPAAGPTDAGGHEPEEDRLNGFDLEREIKLSADRAAIIYPEESVEMLPVECGPAAAPETAPASVHDTTQEVSPEVLQQVIDALDQAGLPQQTSPGQRKPAFARIAALALAIAAIGILFAAGGNDLLVKIMRLMQPAQKASRQEQVTGEKTIEKKEAVTSPHAPSTADTAEEKLAATEDARQSASLQGEQPGVTAQNGSARPPVIIDDTAMHTAAPDPAPEQQLAMSDPQAPSAADNTTAVQTVTETGAEDTQREKQLRAVPVYTIHADSYRTEQSAIEESARLRRLGVAAFVQTMSLKERGVWYRVMIGKFSSYQDAQTMLHALRQTHKKTDARITVFEQ